MTQSVVSEKTPLPDDAVIPTEPVIARNDDCQDKSEEPTDPLNVPQEDSTAEESLVVTESQETTSLDAPVDAQVNHHKAPIASAIDTSFDNQVKLTGRVPADDTSQIIPDQSNIPTVEEQSAVIAPERCDKSADQSGTSTSIDVVDPKETLIVGGSSTLLDKTSLHSEHQAQKSPQIKEAISGLDINPSDQAPVVQGAVTESQVIPQDDSNLVALANTISAERETLDQPQHNAASTVADTTLEDSSAPLTIEQSPQTKDNLALTPGESFSTFDQSVTPTESGSSMPLVVEQPPKVPDSFKTETKETLTQIHATPTIKRSVLDAEEHLGTSILVEQTHEIIDLPTDNPVVNKDESALAIDPSKPSLQDYSTCPASAHQLLDTTGSSEDNLTCFSLPDQSIDNAEHDLTMPLPVEQPQEVGHSSLDNATSELACVAPAQVVQEQQASDPSPKNLALSEETPAQIAPWVEDSPPPLIIEHLTSGQPSEKSDSIADDAEAELVHTPDQSALNAEDDPQTSDLTANTFAPIHEEALSTFNEPATLVESGSFKPHLVEQPSEAPESPGTNRTFTQIQSPPASEQTASNVEEHPTISIPVEQTQETPDLPDDSLVVSKDESVPATDPSDPSLQDSSTFPATAQQPQETTESTEDNMTPAVMDDLNLPNQSLANVEHDLTVLPIEQLQEMSGLLLDNETSKLVCAPAQILEENQAFDAPLENISLFETITAIDQFNPDDLTLSPTLEQPLEENDLPADNASLTPVEISPAYDQSAEHVEQSPVTPLAVESPQKVIDLLSFNDTSTQVPSQSTIKQLPSNNLEDAHRMELIQTLNEAEAPSNAIQSALDAQLGGNLMRESQNNLPIVVASNETPSRDPITTASDGDQSDKVSKIIHDQDVNLSEMEQSVTILEESAAGLDGASTVKGPAEETEFNPASSLIVCPTARPIHADNASAVSRNEIDTPHDREQLDLTEEASTIQPPAVEPPMVSDKASNSSATSSNKQEESKALTLTLATEAVLVEKVSQDLNSLGESTSMDMRPTLSPEINEPSVELSVNVNNPININDVSNAQSTLSKDQSIMDQSAGTVETPLLDDSMNSTQQDKPVTIDEPNVYALERNNDCEDQSLEPTVPASVPQKSSSTEETLVVIESQESTSTDPTSDAQINSDKVPITSAFETSSENQIELSSRVSADEACLITPENPNTNPPTAPLAMITPERNDKSADHAGTPTSSNVVVHAQVNLSKTASIATSETTDHLENSSQIKESTSTHATNQLDQVQVSQDTAAESEVIPQDDSNLIVLANMTSTDGATPEDLEVSLAPFATEQPQESFISSSDDVTHPEIESSPALSDPSKESIDDISAVESLSMLDHSVSTTQKSPVASVPPGCHSSFNELLDSPVPSMTSTPRPTVDPAVIAKISPARHAVSNIRREIILPAKMKKISLLSHASRVSLVIDDLDTLFKFLPVDRPVAQVTTSNESSKVLSNTAPVPSPPALSQKSDGPHPPIPSMSCARTKSLSNARAKLLSGARARSLSSRNKLTKPYPSLKRHRATENTGQPQKRTSYHSLIVRSTKDTATTKKPKGSGAKSLKLGDFGLKVKESKPHTPHVDSSNDLADAFAFIEMSETMKYSPKADCYVNPTLSRRLSKSVKSIFHKRHNRGWIIKNSPLDDVDIPADFHLDMDQELATLSDQQGHAGHNDSTLARGLYPDRSQIVDGNPSSSAQNPNPDLNILVTVKSSVDTNPNTEQSYGSHNHKHRKGVGAK